MRKIISAILVVVMLAALAVVVPASAAATHGLVISEIAVDTTGHSGKGVEAATTSTGSCWPDGTNRIVSGSQMPDEGTLWAMTNADIYTFVEVYNASKDVINLYDYAVTVKTGDAADADKVEKFTPIASPAQMKEAGNKLGTISTAKLPGTTDEDYDFYSSSIWAFYPTNPTTAELEPGETALIWMYNAESYAYNLAASTRVPDKNEDLAAGFDAFKAYWGLEEDTLVVAVDANCSTGSTTIKRSDAQTITKGNNEASKSADEADYTVWADGKIKNNGVADASNDLVKSVYAASNGRFELSNNGVYTYGVGKTESFKTAAPAHADLSAYAVANYADADAEKNAMYKATAGLSTESYVDISYSYIYAEDSKKAEVFGCQYATPGAIYYDQATEFRSELGSVPYIIEGNKEDYIYRFEGEDVVLYEMNFDTGFKADDQVKAGSGSTAETDNKGIGWIRGWHANGNFFNTSSSYAKTAYFRKVADKNGEDTIVLSIESKNKSTNVMSFMEPATAAEKAIEKGGFEYLYADMLYEMDIKFSGATTSSELRNVGIFFNSNSFDSYEVFAINPVGTGVSMRNDGDKWTSAQAIAVDKAGKNYSGNTDANSIISKITDGVMSAGDPNSTSTGENLKMIDLDEWVTIQIVYDQDKGAYALVNGILVSVPVNEAIVGLARYQGDFGFGIYAESAVYFDVDNIKVSAIPESKTVELVGDELDLIYKNGDTMEPKTGDAVIYVAIAMVVSFISLAALVVVKKRTEK